MKSVIVTVLTVIVFLVGSVPVLGQDAGVPIKSLYTAAGEPDIEQLKLHIARKTNVNKADERGYPALIYAANSGATEAVKLLLEAGAQVNAKGPDGRTAIIGAAQGGYKEVVDALLAARADPKAADESKTTAMHVAAAMGHTEVVAALIKAGGDVNAEDRLSQTPLILARRSSRNDISELLVQNGAKEPVVVNPDMLYGDGAAGQQGINAGQGVTRPATAREVTIDANAIREELKTFGGLAAAIKVIDDKNDVEQKGWIQRRTDNRAALVRLVDKQFGDELGFIRKVATEEKAVKTAPAVDELLAKRKLRSAAISEALLQERRTAMEQNTDPMAMGRTRGSNRATRGRAGAAGTQSGAEAYGGSGGRTPRTLARAEPNKPPVDGDTQAQVQAWLNGKPESKDGLLDAVHKLDLAELDVLREVAEGESAKKTVATIHGMMLARQLRVEKITAQWKLDDEREQKRQERMGVQPGMSPNTGVRGTRGTTGQDGQSTTGRTRRYR